MTRSATVRYGKCEIFSTMGMRCPLCGVDVPPNEAHSCESKPAPATKTRKSKRANPSPGAAMSHTCHATDCAVPVPPEMFMCRRHWFSLPQRLRARIWATYRAGQCDDWNISHAYANAARAAVTFIAEKEGKVPDVRVYDLLDPATAEGAGE